MKANTHPTYYLDATVTCACGNVFTTGSTKKDIRVDVCAACHPFFTGQMKFVDTQGRVEKFISKQQAAKPVRKQRKTRVSEQAAPVSLKEMLQEARKKAKQ